ncbi:hypothetical protein RHMOL_Rhmol13G0204500 [Rhododendron molle]|uniref:Uncharacterized protein n=1 Tax=Rhododendron molle TaxID=49168 RepID=A0ACC0L9W1_RHOML|nr:hypothetical protein RHMOL_Rhmol13G0204500 [Rhododendron molle]
MVNCFGYDKELSARRTQVPDELSKLDITLLDKFKLGAVICQEEQRVDNFYGIKPEERQAYVEAILSGVVYGGYLGGVTFFVAAKRTLVIPLRILFSEPKFMQLSVLFFSATVCEAYMTAQSGFRSEMQFRWLVYCIYLGWFCMGYDDTFLSQWHQCFVWLHSDICVCVCAAAADDNNRMLLAVVSEFLMFIMHCTADYEGGIWDWKLFSAVVKCVSVVAGAADYEIMRFIHTCSADYEVYTQLVVQDMADLWCCNAVFCCYHAVSAVTMLFCGVTMLKPEPTAVFCC